MPRKRSLPLYEIGDYWIAREPGRPGLYYYWNDAGARRTRRTKLSAEHLEDAKEELATLVLRRKSKFKANDSHLVAVLDNYFKEKTDHLVSGPSARNAGRLFLECWGEVVKVASLNEERQRHFVAWSLRRNHAISTIARNMGVLAAAAGHAGLEMNIIYSEGAILAKWPSFKPKPPRKIFEPTDEQLARLLAATMPDNLRRWIYHSMATGGRPEAVLGLGPHSRVLDLGLIDLNPAGRRQNKKFRPTVRELSVQQAWLDDWEPLAILDDTGKEVRSPSYCGYASVDSVDTALRRVCAKPEVNLPLLSVYSFRHRVASVLRASRDPKVTGEQISFQLGHRRPGDRTTRGYGAYEPDYLEEAAGALDKWIRRVFALAEAISHGNSHIPAQRAS